jgi:cation transport ATPase
VAGVSLAGKKGILVRNFSAFTQAKRVNTFVFDKTGTITRGNWALNKILPFQTISEDQVLSMAASLEKDSEHYIAIEIKRLAQRRGLDLPEITGIQVYENGLSGWIEKKEVKIGSRDFLQNAIETIPVGALQEDSPFDTAVSNVYMSLDGKLCGILFFGDKIRKGAFSAIDKLRSLGHHLALVSGDGEATTKEVGKKLKIDDSQGGRMPQDKAFFVGAMQEKGLVVSMIGDGVNDAPALAKSDLSFAVYSGSNLGKEAADVTLMRSDPVQVLDFLHLAVQVHRKISQNLVFSSFYNIISIPIAMAGLLTPLIAVTAMLLSSLTVIGNSLLLAKYERDPK